MCEKLSVELDFKILAIEGAIQNYAWGGETFIPNLIGLENIKQAPYAELWIGTHDRGPAQVILEDKKVSLTELIASNPEKILGEKLLQKFGPRLPFLFKVLDVKKMLSIQVHPTKAAAELGFEAENKLGIPLDAKHRNFKDDNHKPEIMVALTDFWLLHGFQSVKAIEQVLERVIEFKDLRSRFEDRNVLELYRYIMELPQVEVDRILAPLAQRLLDQLAQGNLQRSQADYWAASAFKERGMINENLDRGIFSIYLFNLVHLKKGEAIFQAAGIPHAYLEGTNIELMANSDNVFRGGLTYKHIDVPELMKHLSTKSVEPNIIQAHPRSKTEKTYPSPVIDFALSRIEVNENQMHQSGEKESVAAMIVLEGSVWVEAAQERIERKRGEIFFTPANTDYQIKATAAAVLYKASVPI